MLMMRNHLLPLRCLTAAALLLLPVGQTVQTKAYAISVQPPAPVQVQIGSVSAVVGQSVDIPVSVDLPDSGGQIGSYGLQIDYDPNVLQVTGVIPQYGSNDPDICGTAEEGCFVSSYDQPGWLRAVWADASGGDRPILEDRKLFVIKGKVLKAANGPLLSINGSDPEQLTFTDANMHPLVVTTAGGGGAISDPPAAVVKTESKVKIVVNGVEQENSAILTKREVNGLSVISLTVDEKQIIAQLNDNKLKTILLPVTEASDRVEGELNGQLVKVMEGQDATLQIRTERATYTLPAAQINIDSISSAIGKEAALSDIKIRVSIAGSHADKAQQVETAARNGGATLTVPPVDFEVKATYGDKVVDVERFNSYVERAIALPEGVDPSKLTTGVVLHTDGSLAHVPTKIIRQDGRYYAVINSLTNSTYSVVWHPKTFADTEFHWARQDVEDLASRLVIQGVSENAFEPERAITRAEFTSIVLRALGLRSGNGTAQTAFTDVGEEDWFGSNVTAAASYGLISGYEDGSFRPNASITREEAMVILSRAARLAKLETDVTGQADTLLAAFMDQASVDGWARAAVAGMVKLGIVQGSEGQLEPANPITRAQTAAMARRLLIQAQLINP